MFTKADVMAVISVGFVILVLAYLTSNAIKILIEYIKKKVKDKHGN